MALRNIRLMYVHELRKSYAKYNDRVDVWTADEAGCKVNWIGALIKNEIGDIEEVGEIPDHLIRNFTQLLGG